VFPHVQVTSAPRWTPELSQEKHPYDVVIFDRVAAPALTGGNFILIDAVAPNLPLELKGKIQNPRIVFPSATHPLMTDLALGDLTIHEASRVLVKGEGTVLARAAESPLLYALDKGNLRLLFIGFDLMASDLPLRVAFPILFHNALEWFQPQRLEFPGQTTQAGDPLSLRLPGSDGPVEITAPSGKRESLSAKTAPLIFTDTFQAGFYTFKSAEREGSFAVNLFDEEESQILPRVSLTAGARQDAEGSSALESGSSLWPALLGAVLVLLGLELFLALRQGVPLHPIVMRGAALALIAIALLNPRFLRSTTALDVVIGVDLSRSVGQEGREKAQAIIETAGRFKAPDVRTGLLSFGRAPEWESLPREHMPAVDFGARLDRDETDIQAALQAALAQIGEDRQGKIVLISDGNENRGEIARVLPLLRAQDVQVWTVPVSLARGRNEIYLSDLSLPRLVDGAEGFEVRGVIESLRDAPARVRLLRDGMLHAERDLQLKAGSNPLSFRDSLSERGNHSYE
jgi:hypothetical protein